MTPAEAAAYRAGLEAGARVVEDRVPHATGGEIYIIADTAAAIRAMPVPEGGEAHDMTVCERCGTWRQRPCGEGCYWGIHGNEQTGFAALRAVRGQP